MTEPIIIQGGMGAGVSHWKLAKAVSRLGHLGVVSGTGLDTVFIRRLQRGDEDGHLQRALDHFPVRSIAERILDRYLDISSEGPFKRAPMLQAELSQEHTELLVVCNFVEVFLAKEGHDGRVGINYLEKIQMANLPSMYGAMLAGVDYVLIGAGIPREIPRALDALANHERAELQLDVRGTDSGESLRLSFLPRTIIKDNPPSLKRPTFLAIVASTAIAKMLAREGKSRVDGFVVEGSTAGGHNAPPRGKLRTKDGNEPIYGPKDEVDLSVLSSLGLPFWLAGSYGSPEGLIKALNSGATGIQVGTPFALCDESGLADELKRYLLETVLKGEVTVHTSSRSSPTGFPFKIAHIPGTLSEPEVYATRPRRCDLGYLRQVYKTPDGALGYRCPGEPLPSYVKKGGAEEDTAGRRCLCNALLSDIDLAQIQKGGYVERPLVTIGSGVNHVSRFVPEGCSSYKAADVIRILVRGPDDERSVGSVETSETGSESSCR